MTPPPSADSNARATRKRPLARSAGEAAERASLADGSALSKSSPSDRAKFYRRRIREYIKKLELGAVKTSAQVENLYLVIDVQRSLSSRIAGPARQRILAHLWEFVANETYLETHQLKKAQLEVTTIEVQGAVDAPIVRLNAMLRGAYSQKTIEKLYTHVPGNTPLLSHLMHHSMTYPCSFVFFFSADGVIAFESMETEYIGGLVDSVGSLRNAKQLMHGLGDAAPVHKTSEQSIQRSQLSNSAFSIFDLPQAPRFSTGDHD